MDGSFPMRCYMSRLDSCFYYRYPSICRTQGVHVKPDSKTGPGALALQLGYVVLSCKERTVFSMASQLWF